MSRYKQVEGYVMPGGSSVPEGGFALRGGVSERRVVDVGSRVGLGGVAGGVAGGVSQEREGGAVERVESRGARGLDVVEEEEGLKVPPMLSEVGLLRGEVLPAGGQYRLEGKRSVLELHRLREELVRGGRGGLRLEYLDGEIYVTTTALARHVIAVVNLMVSLTLALRREELGQVLTDFTMFLGERDELVPDLLVVLAEDMERLTEKGLRGASTVVVEVLSPSTAYLDRGYKLRQYLLGGAKEYWLVDPVKHEVHIYKPEHVGLHWSAPHEVVRGEGELRTRYVPGFSLPLRGIFDRTFVHVDPVAAEIARSLEEQVQAARGKMAEVEAQASAALEQASRAEAERETEAARAQAALEQAARAEAEREAEAVRAQAAQAEASAAQAQMQAAQAQAARAEAEREAEATRAQRAQVEVQAAQAQATRAEAEREAEATRAQRAQVEAQAALEQASRAEQQLQALLAELERLRRGTVP
ncbi:MAG: Uma2 family endonuclease [Myxococcota bacterium]